MESEGKDGAAPRGAAGEAGASRAAKPAPGTQRGAEPVGGEQHGGQQREAGQREQARVEAAGGGLDPADHGRAPEAAGQADGVDQRDHPGCLGALDEVRGNRPEHRVGHPQRGGGQRQQGQRDRQLRVEARRRGQCQGRRAGRHHRVVAALAGAIRAAPDPGHADRGGQVGDRAVPAERDQVGGAARLEQGGQPEADRVDRGDQAEVGDRQPVDRQVAQGAPEAAFVQVGRGDLGLDALLLLGIEPARVGGAIGQHAQRQEAQQHAGQALHQEHPLPARQAQAAVERGDQRGRQGAAHDAADRPGQEHDGDRAPHPRGAVPARQVPDHAGREAGLEHAEQEAHRVEHRHVAHEQHAGRGDAPQAQDPAEGAARTDPRQQQVAGHLEQHVADEEDAGAHPVGGIRQRQVLLHLQLREADVDAVQVGEQVAEQQERQQPQVDLRIERGRAGVETDAGNSRHGDLRWRGSARPSRSGVRMMSSPKSTSNSNSVHVSLPPGQHSRRCLPFRPESIHARNQPAAPALFP